LVSIKRVFVLIVCSSLVAWADGNTFNKVRYNGGSISTTVKPDDWDNKLTVSSDAIVFALKDGQTLNVPPKQVTSLSYGQEAHRRVGTAIGIAVISLGAGALFALHKTKLHYIGINYIDRDGKKQGMLLQGDKNSFRAIIVALQGVTGVPLSVGDKDRNEIPAGVTVQAVKQPEENKDATQPAAPAVAPATSAPSQAQTDSESMLITSIPDGAEVYVDNSLVGNAPSTLKLKTGKHTIAVKQAGYQDWSREINAEAGTEAHMTATLEKAN
jgi:PEGA domain